MTDEENIILDDFEAVCRTCLQKYDEAHLLYLNEIYITAAEIKLMDILSRYTQIEVSQYL